VLEKVEGISRAGIGLDVLTDLAGTRGRDPYPLSVTLPWQNEALDFFPFPARDWPGLVTILGIDLPISLACQQ